MARNRVLVVDDEASLRLAIRAYLEAKGFDVVVAGSCQQTRELITTYQPDAAILDYELGDGNALDLQRYLKEHDPLLPVIILTGHGSIELAVRAVKEGAAHFLTKPVELPTLQVIVHRAIENRRARQKQLAHSSNASRERPPNPFLGQSDSIRRLAEQVERVAASDSPILIQGETGSGKGVLASWIHEHSPRAQETLVDLNCAGLTPNFLESELFGYEKGAYTGAVTAKMGLLEVGHRGSVFLDEIGDVDPLVQPKLLKVLEEKRFRRMGDVRDRRVDIRLLAATHKNLAELVQSGRFRSDLYFRINTIPLYVPSLRERSEDIPVLAQHLLHNLSTALGCIGVCFTSGAIEQLRGYAWPGNIRELRNVIERALLLRSSDVISANDLLFDRTALSVPQSDDTMGMTLSELEQMHIERILRDENGRVIPAAKRLGIPRSTLYQKIKKYGMGR